MAHIYTIGHSTRSAAAFVELLAHARVLLLADVRSFPQSRRNPQFNADALAEVLREAGIDYKRIPELGGLISRQPNQGPSPNGFWDNDIFRAYADYAATASFKAGLDTLRALAQTQTSAIMCAEADWRRCHRRIIADCLLATGDVVTHISGDGKLEPAQITQAAVIAPNGVLTYPAAQGQLL